MIGRCFPVFLAIVVVSGTLVGCKPKEEPSDVSSVRVSSGQVASMRDALAKGMQAVHFSNLSQSHVGRTCVIVTKTPDLNGPPGPPPPLGMVYRLGSTSIYKAHIRSISADALEIEEPYPGSSNKKVIEIPQADIQSIHLGK